MSFSDKCIRMIFKTSWRFIEQGNGFI